MEKRLINLKGFQPNRLVNDNIYDSKQFSLLRYSLFQNAYYNLPSHEVIQKSTCECRDTNLLRSQIWRFFFGPAPPPNRICPCNPPWKIYFFLFGPPPLPLRNFLGKNVDLSVRDLNLLNTHPIRLSLIQLFATNNMHFARK